MNDDGVNSYTYNIFRYRAILFPYFSVIGISINIHKVLWNDASRKGELMVAIIIIRSNISIRMRILKTIFQKE